MKISINPLNCFYSVSKFDSHEAYKEELLKRLEYASYKSPKHEKAEVSITKTDWYISTSLDREWLKLIIKDLSSHISASYLELGYGGFTLNEIWFQQYLENSEHGWHTHSGNFTNVYYVELPEDAPKTTIVDPYTKKQIILDVKEGDIVTFPSFVLHKTLPNQSKNRKTIISYNTNATYPDDFYGKGV
jgi:hypothetical protein